MAAANLSTQNKIHRVVYFFPFQLLMIHLKKNYLLLFFWLILFLLITGNFAYKYGGQYLFLYPEYLGNVDFLSHLIMGFLCGGFIMAFNISSYIVNGFRFPFIATLSRPFLKYCINNFIIPLAFVGLYVYQLIYFQTEVEYIDNLDVAFNVAGFLGGNVLFIILTMLYFVATNKDIFLLFGIDIHQQPKKRRTRKSPQTALVDAALYKHEKWYNFFTKPGEWRVDTYLSGFSKISLARGSEHYDARMLQNVFAQNHLNASYFEFIIIVAIMVLGTFRENMIFQIPAGASVLLLFTIMVMITSALFSWLKGWSTAVFLTLFILINYLSQYAAFNYTNHAYGLQYKGDKALYNSDRIMQFNNNKANFTADSLHTVEILNNWKNSFTGSDSGFKPKLVMLNTSGGGLRSTLWTINVLQYCDSVLAGKIFKDTRLITGSSGGMMGAAYMRELYLRSLSDKKINMYADSIPEMASQDLLNAMVFTITVNDLFFRTQRFEVGEKKYVKDRGYTFESEFNKNTGHILDKTIAEYTKPERDAVIPMMVLSPTIINDGRRLIISSQPVSYLATTKTTPNVNATTLTGNIEFRRFFEKQDADQLKFTSALRMSATFPYILPYASMPSEPLVEIMDAGMRDNFGLITTLKFLNTFNDWINQNTSGVVILQIRDNFKEDTKIKSELPSVIQSFINPIGSFYSVWPDIQNYEQDEMIAYAGKWFNGQIDVVPFQLKRTSELISMSWHLTSSEKHKISRAIFLPENQESVKRLKLLLGDQKNQ